MKGDCNGHKKLSIGLGMNQKIRGSRIKAHSFEIMERREWCLRLHRSIASTLAAMRLSSKHSPFRLKFAWYATSAVRKARQTHCKGNQAYASCTARPLLF